MLIVNMLQCDELKHKLVTLQCKSRLAKITKSILEIKCHNVVS